MFGFKRTPTDERRYKQWFNRSDWFTHMEDFFAYRVEGKEYAPQIVDDFDAQSNVRCPKCKTYFTRDQVTTMTEGRAACQCGRLFGPDLDGAEQMLTADCAYTMKHERGLAAAMWHYASTSPTPPRGNLDIMAGSYNFALAQGDALLNAQGGSAGRTIYIHRIYIPSDMMVDPVVFPDLRFHREAVPAHFRGEVTRFITPSFGSTSNLAILVRNPGACMWETVEKQVTTENHGLIVTDFEPPTE